MLERIKNILSDPKKVFPILFGLGILFSVLPFLLGKYFLTGDGPVHLHNSRVLKDLVFGDHADFYSAFYLLNPNPAPNWFSHILLAILMVIFPAFIAEKILLVGYALLFAFGLRKILETIRKGAGIWALVGMIFLHNHVFQMGFWNFSIGLALLFWVLAYWIQFMQKAENDQFRIGKLVQLAGLVLLLYLSHPVPWVFALLSFATITIAGLVFKEKWLKKACWTMLASLPALGLFLYFLIQKGGQSHPNPKGYVELMTHLVNLYSLVVLKNFENWPVRAMVALLSIGITLFSIEKFRNRKFEWRDGFYAMGGVSILIFFFAPEGIAGGGILSLRLQMFPWLFALFWLAAWNKIPLILEKAVPVIGFLIIAILFIIRLPVYLDLQNATNEYMEAVDLVEEESTLLAISYNHNGLNEQGEIITTRTWLFPHIGCYAGAEKPLVLFDNYQGNTGFFPILWNEKTTPYIFLKKGHGIEAEPPGIDVPGYEFKTGQKVDYALVWGDRNRFEGKEDKEIVDGVLANNYESVLKSGSGRVELFKRKN